MGEAARIWTTVGANIAPLKAGLAEAGAATDKFGSGFGASLARHEAGMNRVGRAWQRNVTLPMVAAGAVAVKMGLDFQQQMALISTSAGASASDVQKLTGQVLQLAKVSPYGPTELAKALYHLKSLGYDNVTAMQTLRVAINGAMAGNSDLESTTSALGAAIRTNIKGTGDFQQAMATLNATVGAGNMRMGDLIAALGTGVLPAAKFAGISLKEVGAALALMVDEGMPATQAATRFRMGLTMMEHGSKSANKALSEIHLTTDQLSMAMHSPAGLIGGLQLLKNHLDQLGQGKQLEDWAKQVNRGKLSVEQFTKLAQGTKQFDVLAGAFGGARSSAAIILMLNNLDVLKQKLQQIEHTAGQFGSKVQQAKNLDINKLKTDWSSVEVQLIKAGDAILPFVLKMGHGLGEASGWFDHLNSEQKKFLEVAAAAAVIGGPLLIFTSRMIGALQIVRGAFGKEAAASTEATGVVTANMERQGAAVTGISWKQVNGAWVAEGVASTEATGVVLSNVERQGLAMATLRGELLALSSKAFVVTMVLSMIPQSKHGADLLDKNSLGFFNHVPLLNRVAQYGAVAGNAAGQGFDSMFGVSDAQRAAAAKRRYELMHPTPQAPTNMTLTYPEWLKLHPTASQFGDVEAQKVYAGYRRRAEAKYQQEVKLYEVERKLYEGQMKKHLTEAQRRANLMKKAEQQFQHQWDSIFGKAGYTPPNLPGSTAAGSSSATSYSLPAWVTTMQAKADALAAMNPNQQGATKLQVQAAQAAKAAAMAAIRAHGKAWEGAADAWNAVAAANQVLYQQAAGQNFALPMKIQLAQAKADALAALNPDLQGPTSAQIKAAQMAKAAAMKAIKSHTLTMANLIAAWNIVSQANSVLAQAMNNGQAHTYAAESTSAVTKGLHLTRAQRTALEERLAQRDAHGGNRPVGPASDGVVVKPRHHHHHHHHSSVATAGDATAMGAMQGGSSKGGGDVIVKQLVLHGQWRNIEELLAELRKIERKYGQRTGQR